MATKDKSKALEMNHMDMQDRLDKLEKHLKDEIAQAQKDTVSQIAAMLGFKDPERGKAVEAVDVLSPQSKIYMAGTSTHIPTESGMNHGKNQGSEVLHRVGMNKKFEERFAKLEEIIREMQGGNIYGGVDARDLSLVTDLVTPPKFKIPEFEKYDGTTCPLTHLTMYCRRMPSYLENEKLLIHCFQDSLSGSAARWYNQLSRVNIKTWHDLSRAFLKQYKHVTDMVPSMIVLQDMEPMSNESFHQYAQRWRDVAAQVQPPLSEREVTPMFVETLTGPFYDRMLNHATKDFTDMVLSGELILVAIRSGRLKEEEYDEH
ncbi:hypothetical protein GQ457_12G001480 [Hibiscus cannabinus]